MCGGDKNRAARVPSLTNEEPLVVVKACVDIVWEVIGEDGGNGRRGVVRKGKTSLCCGGRGSVSKRALGAENRDVSCGWSCSGHWGSEVFTSGGSDEDIIGVDGNIFVERGEEESVEDFLGDLGRSGRHGRWDETIELVSSYNVRRPGFLRGIFGWFS
jgi:hypothetical protein